MPHPCHPVHAGHPGHPGHPVPVIESILLTHCCSVDLIMTPADQDGNLMPVNMVLLKGNVGKLQYDG